MINTLIIIKNDGLVYMAIAWANITALVDIPLLYGVPIDFINSVEPLVALFLQIASGIGALLFLKWRIAKMRADARGRELDNEKKTFDLQKSKENYKT